MNILFFTIAYPITNQNIYTDLADEFRNQGNSIIVCTQDETRTKGPISISYRNGICILSIPTGKITKTTFIKKGINTLLFEHRLLKKLSYINFKRIDVLIYSSPPVNINKIIKKLKKTYHCISYLWLKDIFPQNAVDLKIFNRYSLLYSFFRHKERMLYRQSDIIGCLSPANVQYLYTHNKYLPHGKIHIAPNCISPSEIVVDNKITKLEKYNIPLNTIHLVYGGNLGKPQGIDFLIKCIDRLKDDTAISIAIIGEGTEYSLLENYLSKNKIYNAKLMKHLSKDEYLRLLCCMDIGLVFLDSRFTIPNFPMRILDYMNASLPIIACTDSVCDIKQEICDEGAGFWCKSDNIDGFVDVVEEIKRDKINICETKGKRSRELLFEKYTVINVAKNIINQIDSVKISEFK